MAEVIEAVRYCVNGAHKAEEKPREAYFGHFCSYEHGTAKHALALVPGLVQHIVSLIPMDGGQDETGRVHTSREAPAPGNEQARDDANDLYRVLTAWCKTWAGRMKAQAPGPAKRSWRSLNGEVIGLPSGSPGRARYEVGIMSKWLEVHLGSIFTLDPGEVNQFLLALRNVYRLNARWPQQMRPRYSDMPCPTCPGEEKGAIAVFPPDEYLDDERIVCVKCGRWFEPKDYEFLIGVFKQQREEGLRATRTRRHLERKYGRTEARS